MHSLSSFSSSVSPTLSFPFSLSPSVANGCPERNEKESAEALHPFYLALPTPGVLIEIEGESFRCMRGVGSYLIHSPWVLPTPRGDYFTANGGSNSMVVEGKREQRDARHTSAPEIDVSFETAACIDPNRSCIDADLSRDPC